MSEGVDADADAVKRAQVRVGQVLKEKWTIERLLGVGGMAAVYRAVHRNGNEVAVKMLHPEISMHGGIRERFLREGYVANKVKHDGAVTVFDDDVTEDGAAFLVMELLEGESFEGRRLRMGGRVPPDDVLSLTHQLLDVLVAAHANEITHRDLKPENVFLTRAGVVKVLDFGIARVRELSGQSSATQTGSMMGTPAFMAPEQARGRWNEVDARTDLWAVGATMFTMLTGKYVHEAETVTEAVALAITQQARSISSVDPAVHPAIVALVDRALAYQRDARWRDARAMQAATESAYRSVAGAAPMRVATPSVALAHGKTVAASSDVISQITGAAPAATAGSGMTASLATPRAGRLPLYLGGAGAAVVLAIVGAVVTIRTGDSVHEGPAVALPDAPVALAAPVPQPIAPTIVEPLAEPALPSAMPTEPSRAPHEARGTRARGAARAAPPPPFARAAPALAAPKPPPAAVTEEDITRRRR